MPVHRGHEVWHPPAHGKRKRLFTVSLPQDGRPATPLLVISGWFQAPSVQWGPCSSVWNTRCYRSRPDRCLSPGLELLELKPAINNMNLENAGESKDTTRLRHWCCVNSDRSLRTPSPKAHRPQAVSRQDNGGLLAIQPWCHHSWEKRALHGGRACADRAGVGRLAWTQGKWDVLPGLILSHEDAP